MPNYPEFIAIVEFIEIPRAAYLVGILVGFLIGRYVFPKGVLR